MPIAAGFLPNHHGAAQAGQNALEILDHSLNPLCFRSKAEQLLFEVEIQRQRSGKMIGKGRVLAFRKILLSIG